MLQNFPEWREGCETKIGVSVGMRTAIAKYLAESSRSNNTSENRSDWDEGSVIA